MRTIIRLLADEDLQKVDFTNDEEFIAFVNKIREENDDTTPLTDVGECVSYLFQYCDNLSYHFTHPEILENEVLLINVKDDEDMFVHSLPDWLTSVRKGDVVYATHGTYIVPDMKPLFGLLKQNK
jgi:hypothetical protein